MRSNYSLQLSSSSSGIFSRGGRRLLSQRYRSLIAVSSQSHRSLIAVSSQSISVLSQSISVLSQSYLSPISAHYLELSVPSQSCLRAVSRSGVMPGAGARAQGSRVAVDEDRCRVDWTVEVIHVRRDITRLDKTSHNETSRG